MLLDAPQAYQQFLEGFIVPVYDENVVPEDAPFPRITYTYAEAEFEQPVALSLSLWDRSYSWTRVTALAGSIRNAIPAGPAGGGIQLDYDGGKIWLKRGTPFAQRMSDEDDAIRRIYINLEAEFLTAE